MKQNKTFKKGNSFLKSASLLTFAIFLARIIGAIHRVPLAHILGTTGMGIYQLVFPVYSFLLATSSGALPIAISMIVSQRIGNNDKQNARDILCVAMSMLLLTGLITSISIALLSGILGKLQGSMLTRMGYIAIAPAVLFTSGIAVLRGWFQGNEEMRPSAISQVTEAIIKLIAGLVLATILLPFGIEYAVAGALSGVTLAEAITLLILYMIYRRNNPRIKLKMNFIEAKSKYKEIIKLTLPMTMGGMILPLSQMIDSLLVLNLTNKYTGSQIAVSEYGLYTGYVGALINFPITTAISLGIAVAPALRRDIAEYNITGIRNKIHSSFKTTLLACLPFAIFYVLAPSTIVNTLYPSLNNVDLAKAITFLRIGGISVVGLSITQIYASILQGIKKMYIPVRNMGIGACLKLAISIILAPSIGIYGIVIATCIFFVAVAVLNYISIIRYTGKNWESQSKGIAIIFLSIIICGGLIVLIDLIKQNWITIIAMMGLSALFILVVIATGIFSDNELSGFPFSKSFLKFSKLMRRVFGAK
jgi:stage V sporulation protein B